MKKILMGVITLMLCLSLNAGERLSIDEVHALPMVKQFKMRTGYSKESVNLMVSDLQNDTRWQEAVTVLAQLNSEKYQNYANVREGAPKVITSLAALDSANNPLPAYLGVLSLTLFYGQAGEYTRKYLSGFIDVLVGKELCFGYVAKAQAYAKGVPGYAKSHKGAYETLREASDVCANPKLPYTVRDAYARALSRERFLASKGL